MCRIEGNLNGFCHRTSVNLLILQNGRESINRRAHTHKHNGDFGQMACDKEETKEQKKKNNVIQ